MNNERDDHDQRLKTLLKEFFEHFFLCFFPLWAKPFDFSEVIWLDKEFFLSPPAGEKRHLDLVARLRIREDAPPPWPGCDGLLVLVHIEVESGDSVQPLRPRMFEYYCQLRRDSQLPVLPIGLYLQVGLNGVGWDSYEERFWEEDLLRFRYAYVGLPALSAEEYIAGGHVLGAALSTLMRVPAERRVELHLEALQRIAISRENDLRRHLLAECLAAYSKIEESEISQLNAMLSTEPYKEARPIMSTLYEYLKAEGLRQGKLEGRLEGKNEGKIEGKIEGRLEERLEIVLIQLEAKFGTLSPETTQRVREMDAEQLRRLSLELLRADSLKELQLQD